MTHPTHVTITLADGRQDAGTIAAQTSDQLVIESDQGDHHARHTVHAYPFQPGMTVRYDR